MEKKLSRILGIVGAVLTILPCIILTAYCAYQFALPSEPLSEFDDLPNYKPLLFIVGLIYIAVAIPGLVGSLLVNKKRKASAILMLISGVLMLVPEVPFYLRTGPILLIVAGILALIKPKPAALPSKPESDAAQTGI